MTIPANKNVPDGIYEVAPNDNNLLYTTLSNFIGITDSQYCRACLNVRRISIFHIAYNRLDRGTVFSDFIDYKRRGDVEQCTLKYMRRTMKLTIQHTPKTKPWSMMQS